MAEFKYTYGWKKDNPDMRDLRFTYRYPEALPDNIDLRKYTLKIYDQGPLGSCTANAGGALFEMIRTINDLPTYSPSRLYIYYNTRAYEGTIPYDAGAGIRSAIKSLSEEGCPKEESWPYEVEKFTMMPPDTVYKEGRKHVIWKYKRINNQYLTDIQHALSLGYPVVAGFSVYESFEDPIVAGTGYMNMPKPYEQMKGGHAVLIVGYQNETQRFIVRNSWGEKWGEKGYFYAPYAYFTNPYLAGDFWTAVLAS